MCVFRIDFVVLFINVIVLCANNKTFNAISNLLGFFFKENLESFTAASEFYYTATV